MDAETRRNYYKTRRREQRAEGMRRVSVTLDPTEYARLVVDAKMHRTQPTANLKRLALAQLDRVYLVPPDQGERLDVLIAVLRGVGNNLNQLARHANEMRAFMDTDSVRLRLQYMEDEIRRFVKEPEQGRAATDTASPPLHPPPKP